MDIRIDLTDVDTPAQARQRLRHRADSAALEVGRKRRSKARDYRPLRPKQHPNVFRPIRNLLRVLRAHYIAAPAQHAFV